MAAIVCKMQLKVQNVLFPNLCTVLLWKAGVCYNQLTRVRQEIYV